MKKHGRWLTIGLCLLGAICGALAGRYAALRYDLRLGREHLEDYAQRVMKVTADSNAEMEAAADAVRNAHLDFCSEAEIAFMRDYIFNASHIRDLGHEKDDTLFCTSTAGLLKDPPVLHRKADVVVGDWHFFAKSPLIISSKSEGLILRKMGVSVVLNPVVYDSINEPPMYFAASLFEPSSGRVVHVLGKPMPLRGWEARAGTYVEKKGVFYKPVCSTEAIYCIAVAESRADMLAHSGPLRRVCAVTGGVIGYGAVLIVILWWRRQKTMERQLRRALKRDALTLVYQPVVDLATGRTVGAEALVRWVDESGASVRPDIFVALAEEFGFVDEITQFVIRRSLQELGGVMKQGYRVSINIAASDLTDAAFFLALDKELIQAQVASSALGLELTERSTADQKVAIEAVARLNRQGHAVYIDDFGTGYSSLAYLHQLAITAIKIDRAFTQTVGTEAVTASVVPQILQMAKQLNLRVVVEGVETEEQAEYFRAYGNGVLGQGWLFGKPVSAEKLLERIAAERKRGVA